MKDQQCVITTLENIPGMDIEQHFGMVTASIIMSQSSFKKVLGNFKKFFGGEVEEQSAELQKLKTQALDELQKNARALGANAIVCAVLQHIRSFCFVCNNVPNERSSTSWFKLSSGQLIHKLFYHCFELY